MKRIELSEAALADLRDILHYTRLTWGVDRALTYVDDIEALLQRVARGLAVTRPASHLRPGYRSIRHKRHVIYLTEGPGQIHVIRILHERMDTRHLADED